MRPLALLLLPRTLDGFILRDQAQDLLARPGVVAVEPPRVPYGALGRLPAAMAARVARRQARRLVRTLDRHGDTPRVIVIFHPFQAPLALAVCDQVEGCELWYGRWDRYEEAYDASTDLKVRLAELHEQAAARSALTFVASDKLAALETGAGRAAVVTALSADDFPSPDPGGVVIAASLGHLGHRTDWALLHAVAERMADRLVVLLIGAWHDDECRDDTDYAWCRAHPGFVWLGRRSDEEAARLLLCADCGIVPFERSAFNDAGLPYRILKAARLGRMTVCPDLAGVRTWDRAVLIAPEAEAFAAALASQSGRRTAPDADLRAWALAQTARAANAPLHERLTSLGIT